MKSVVLCENTLIKRQGDKPNLKEDVKDEQLERKVKLNGTAVSKKSESEVRGCNSLKKENHLQNGKNGTAERLSVIGGSKNRNDKTDDKKLKNNKQEENAPSSEDRMTVTMETNTSSTKKSKNCLEGSKNSLDISENLCEDSNALNSSDQDSDTNKNEPVLCVNVDCFDEVSDEVNEISIIDDFEGAMEQGAINSTPKNVNNKFLPEVLPKIGGNESEIFDVDSNKENVKDGNGNSMEDLPGNSEDGVSSSEIQVEKVQSFPTENPDFMWLSSNTEKSHQADEESTHEKSGESEGVISNNSEEEKEAEFQPSLRIDSVSSANVGIAEQMECGQEMELNEETAWDGSTAEAEGVSAEEKKDSESGVGLSVSKKRRMTNKKEGAKSAKKLKLSEKQNLEGNKVEVRGNVEDSSKVKETSFERETTEAKEVTGEGNLESTEDIEKVDKPAAPSSSFLASFRGTLKNLTRSDLEELIVQKLCEVITERSTVGELRKKAQALEQDQERWKTKIQALSKQIKEMEMVMKKYMSEVQRQLKDGANMVTPLRVTRSVGLQVSFYTYPNRGVKPNLSPPATPCPAQTTNTRNSKGSPKPPQQLTSVSQNLRSKSMPVSPKSSPSLQKAPPTQQRRHSVTSNSTPPNRVTTTAATPVTNRPAQVQVAGPRPAYKPITSTIQQQQLQQQSQQLLLGSKVIDLTEDDDQRINNPGKPNSPRVVSHLPQSGSPANNRYAYLVPATSTSTGLGGTQNRQVLIATPAIQTSQQNRQIMCSMPPLLFKGGNAAQPAPQPAAISQNNTRVILPKVLRHPAPLPQTLIRNYGNMKHLPPRPALKISKVQTGIVLSWNMVLGPEHAPIRSYQLYAYQESNSPPATSLWKKVGDVRALPLPMACTLTQFMSGHKYHFAVRAVDHHSRSGPFSFPATIVLVE